MAAYGTTATRNGNRKNFTEVPLPGIEGSEEKPKRGVGVNSVTLVGRLVADPEFRLSEAGMAKTTMRIATNDRNEPEFHDIVTFSTLAERSAQFLLKGRLVYVNGRLHTREYETRTGKKRATEIVADNVQFLDSREAA